MKIFTTLILLAAGIMMHGAAQAQKLSPLARLTVESGAAVSGAKRAAGIPNPYMPMIMQLTDESDASTPVALEELGVKVWHQRHELLLVSVPAEKLDAVLSLPGVVAVGMSGDMSSCMDRARQWGDVDAVHNGYLQEMIPYTGKGVVVGWADIGFDWQHIAFSDGRLKQLHHFDAAHAFERSASATDGFEDWTIDCTDEYHATHVGNILAGGFTDAPYHGVAPGADIVATTSCLTDVGILCGVESVIEYARSVGAPAVVNVSMGNYLGPHDGTSLISKYLNYCSEDAVITLSAGNTGSITGYASFTPRADVAEADLRINELPHWQGFDVDGYTDIWSCDSNPVEVRIGVFDDMTKSIVWMSDPLAATESGSERLDSYGTEALRQYMSKAEYTLAWEVNPRNGRWNATLHYVTTSPTQCEPYTWARYFTVVRVRPVAGQTVDLFADAARSFFQSVPGSAMHIGTEGSVSDMATAPGVICVGSVNSRSSAPCLDRPEQPYVWDMTEGAMSSFSSYSTAPRIQSLPHVSAPGAYVVSAVSEPFITAHPDGEKVSAAVVGDDGRVSYYSPVRGTSMSSPFVAGVAALWLEANPNLSPAEVRDLAISTATRFDDEYSRMRSGAGCINALGGLKDLFTTDSPMHPADKAEPLVWITSDGRVEVVGADLTGIYSIDGTRINGTRLPARGIYIVSISGYPARKICM